MGQLLGLQHERESAGISLFDTQMRRRLWWQVIVCDNRSAQLAGLQGQGPSFSEPVTFSLPANLNDSDMSPEMTEMPVIHKGHTEMIFCLVRYELGKFLGTNGRKLHNPQTSLWDKDQLINEFEDTIERDYLRYCDTANPLHLISSGGARSAICKMRLLAHHPSQYPDKGASMPQAEKDMLFATSLKMVEYDVLGQSTRTLERFSWHTEHYFQLDAFVYMLIASLTQIPGALMDKAWCLISDIYKYRPSLVNESKELYVEVRALTLRAWEAREANLTRLQLGPVVIPSIISKLRSNLQPAPTQLSNNSSEYSYDSMQYQQSMTAFTSSTGDGISATTPVDDGWQTGFGVVDWDHWNHLLEANVA